MTTTEYVLREFVCNECGHTVVVNPNLPADYTPTVCCQCYDQVVMPRAELRAQKSMAKLLGLLPSD